MNKEKLVEYLINLFYDERDGFIDLTDLNFGDYSVDISRLKTEGNLYQSEQNVGRNLHQDRQIVEDNLWQQRQTVENNFINKKIDEGEKEHIKKLISEGEINLKKTINKSDEYLSILSKSVLREELNKVDWTAIINNDKNSQDRNFLENYIDFVPWSNVRFSEHHDNYYTIQKQAEKLTRSFENYFGYKKEEMRKETHNHLLQFTNLFDVVRLKKENVEGSVPEKY